VNQNLARAVGPAIGGVLLAATSAALVFLANAISFLAVLGAVAVTAIPKIELTLPREHAVAAARAGGRVEEGPVVIAVAYPLAPGNADAFLAQTAELRRSRRRTGAIHWHLHRDLADPDLFEEMFVVGSWEEHERQHQRLAGRERAVLDTIDTLLADGHSRVARHLLGVRPPREPQR
jgi:quinol monooxygenase YgiN